jgi:glycosyltransferase involved in cell wall biosynthesis
MIEAMACGTPVLAYRAGAVEEVIDEGVTGMIVDNIDQASPQGATPFRGALHGASHGE